MVMPDCLPFVDERRSVKRMGSAAGFSFPPHPLPPVPFLALASCVRATSPWLSLSLSPAKRKRKRLLRRLVLKVPCTLRWGNFKTEVFTLKTYQMFFVHTTPQEFKNATITGHFGFLFEENSVRETAWLSWSQCFRKASFSVKMFSVSRSLVSGLRSSLRRKSDVFKVI